MSHKKTGLTLIFFITQLYFLFKFSNYTSYGYLVVFILAFPIYLATKLFVQYLVESKNNKEFSYVKELLVILALSALIYISLFKKWVDTNYLESFVLSFSRFSFVFVFTYTFSNYLIKASLKNNINLSKRYFLLIYALPSLIIMTSLWLAAYPAVMSPDSIYFWTAVVRNSYDGLHPILYLMGTKLLSLIWESPSIIIIFQILLCSFTFAYVSYRLRSWGVNKYLCLVLAVGLPLMPINSILTVSLWKDVPYTMGLILISIEMIRAIKEKKYYRKKSNIILFFILLIFTMATRHNAPYVLFCSMITYISLLLYKKRKREGLINAIIIILCLVVLVSSTAITKKALGENYVDLDASSSFYALPLQGIMAAYHDAPLEITESQKKKMEKYLYLDEVQSHFEEFSKNERWRNFTRTRSILNINLIDNDKLGFLSLYLDFLIQNPVIVIRSYFNQTSIIWCSRDTSYISGMGWYIASAEGFEEIISDTKFPWLSEQVEAFLYSNPKGIRGFFEHPASMMLLILILAYVGIKKKGIKSIVFILPALFNSLGYMATIEGQCTRYTYVNFTIAIVYFIFILLDEENLNKVEKIIDISE